MTIKVGSRLRSQADDTEVIVVRTDDGVAEVSCGGHPMVDLAAPSTTRLDPATDAAGGNELGKRYTIPGTKLEVLVTKAGTGSLAADGTPLVAKEAKPLPASD